MNSLETIIAGTIQPDGSLVLDQKLNLPPGRVQVVVQVLPDLPADDPFWQRMQAIWAIPRSSTCDGGRKTIDEVVRAREEWDEHQQALESLQRE
ncbi:MAG: hypothetical protein ACKOU6_02085 [Planctomycetota bacterium]